jgi:hypothetical protein
MNDLSSDIGLLKRQFRDVHAVVSRLDTQTRKLFEPVAAPRPAGLTARFAACCLIAKLERRTAADVAKQSFADDRDLQHLIELRAASGPATTTQATWAAELIGVTVADIAQNLLPTSTFAQLRSMGMQYTFAGGPPVRVPFHNPSASGGFTVEGGPIPAAAMLLSSLTLKPKRANSIIAMSRELLQSGPANVETSLRALIADDLGLMIDGILLGNTAATAAAPAGLLAGLTSLGATAGGGMNAMFADMTKLLAATSPNLKPLMIMGTAQLAQTAIVVPPIGIPVIVSPNMPANQVVMIDASCFASALGTPDFNVSENPSVHMDTVPLPLASGPQGSAVLASPTQSMWQTATTGLRSIIEVDWALRRTNAVAFISSVTW